MTRSSRYGKINEAVRTVLLACIGLILLASSARFIISGQQRLPDEPRYTRDGRMLRPNNYREWIWLSSGLGMSYNPAHGDNDHPSFDNVFVTRAAYRSFLQTGNWPDKTILVLEARASANKGSINQSGHFQTTLLEVEAHVKDESRFPGKWAFFAFGGSTEPAAMIPTSASCYSCHQQHAAVDTTFVQFYPTLLEIAKQKGTLKEY